MAGVIVVALKCGSVDRDLSLLGVPPAGKVSNFGIAAREFGREIFYPGRPFINEFVSLSVESRLS